MVQSTPDYDHVKTIVSALIKKHWLQKPPIDPVAIAKKHGIGVKFVTLSGEYDCVSGFYYHDEKTIYINQNEPPLRKTFVIAHELAHALLHKEWSASDNYAVQWCFDSTKEKNAYYKEADAFASWLLVPREILDLYYSILSESDLSKLFAVSVPLIRDRLAFEYGIVQNLNGEKRN